MSIVYSCPNCGRQIAMLTNQAETQIVRSLGVKIGGRSDVAAPMESLRSNLAMQREGVETTRPSTSQTKCPFTGMVNEAFARDALTWSDPALARLESIPAFVRPMVRTNVEDYAREQGYVEITELVMDEVKAHLEM